MRSCSSLLAAVVGFIQSPGWHRRSFLVRQPKGFPCHECAPKAWRRVPNMTGDHEMDASILHSRNRDMAKKIHSHLSTEHYGPKTGYSGYGSGDD